MSGSVGGDDKPEAPARAEDATGYGRRLGLRRTFGIIGGGALVSYGVPPALYAWFAHRPLEWAAFWQHAAQPYATLAAGLGAISAGVLAFYNGQYTREADKNELNVEQKRHEVERLQETKRDLHARFTTATGQLASDTAMSRQAGVHAIAALADDWHALEPTTRQIQVCVDVLCSYLRRPWKPHGETDATAEELVVRETIYAALRNHLQPNAAPSWSACTLNLAGAHLHDIDLHGTLITAADFSGATFTGAVMFRGTRFVGASEDAIVFDGATFVATSDTDWTDFGECTFDATAMLGISFEDVEFLAQDVGTIGFHDATFSSTLDAGITLYKTSFTTTDAGAIEFNGAKFRASNPGNVRFKDDERPCGITFMAAKFTSAGLGGITFNRASFVGDDAEIGFPDAQFNAATNSFIIFNNVAFRNVTFNGAMFEGPGRVSFGNPSRWENVQFDWDDNTELKPEAILQANWPPALTTDDSDLP